MTDTKNIEADVRKVERTNTVFDGEARHMTKFSQKMLTKSWQEQKETNPSGSVAKAVAVSGEDILGTM